MPHPLRRRRLILGQGLGLNDAVAYALADHYSGSGQWLDETGNSHHATLGSTSGADTNDPTFLAFTGKRYLYNPGIATNYLSTPDAAALDLTGEISVRQAIIPSDINAALATVGKFGSGVQRSYKTRLIAGTSRVRGSWDSSTAGAADVTTSNTADIPAISNVWGLRHDFNPNNGANRVLSFYYKDLTESTDLLAAIKSDAGWTLVQTTTGATTTVHVGTEPLTCPANPAGSSNPFKVYCFVVQSGLVGGTVVADPDLAAAAPTAATFVDAAGLTWTLNRTADTRKLVMVDSNRFLIGTDDYFYIDDHARLRVTTGAFGLLARVRVYGTPTANHVLVAKKVDVTTGAGYCFYRDTAGKIVGVVADGTSSTTVTGATVLTAGVDYNVLLVRGGGVLQLYLNGVLDGTAPDATGSLTNTEELRIGRLSGAGTTYAAAEIAGWALFARSVSASGAMALHNELA